MASFGTPRTYCLGSGGQRFKLRCRQGHGPLKAPGKGGFRASLPAAGGPTHALACRRWCSLSLHLFPPCMSLSCHTAFFLMRTPVMLDDIILTNYLGNSPIPNKVMLRPRVVTTLIYELGGQNTTHSNPCMLLRDFC